MNDWFDRAVEIKVLANGSPVRRGSGFMIAPGVILTALHVVAGTSPVPAQTVRCEVRLLQDINAHARDPKPAPFCEALLKWPAAGATLSGGDVALIVVAPEHCTQSMTDCPALPVLNSRDARAVTGVGMPALAAKIGVSDGFREINGRIGIRLRENALLELTLDDQKHPDPAEWKGASGAVLLDALGQALVGILVQADHTGYDEVVSDVPRPLMLEMLADYAQQVDFQAVVDLAVISEAGASTGEVPPKFVRKARELLHLLDRTSQTRQVGRLLRNATTGKYRPMVLVSHMKERDCPDVFLETLSEQLMTAFKDRKNCYWKPSNLGWRLGTSPQRAVASLKANIIDDVAAADEAGLDATLLAGQTKRFFAVRIDSEAEPPTQETLKDLFSWWFGRPDCEGGPAILLIRVVDTTTNEEPCPKAKTVYSLAESLFPGPPPFADAEQVLEPLARCRMDDLLTWSDIVLKTSVGNYNDSLVRRLNTRIASDAGAGNTFPLRIIRDALI